MQSSLNFISNKNNSLDSYLGSIIVVQDTGYSHKLDGTVPSIRMRVFTDAMRSDYSDATLFPSFTTDNNETTYARLLAPTPSIESTLNQRDRDVITRDFLNNTGNNVVHKYGTETIEGGKYFKSYPMIGNDSEQAGYVTLVGGSVDAYKSSDHTGKIPRGGIDLNDMSGSSSFSYCGVHMGLDTDNSAHVFIFARTVDTANNNATKVQAMLSVIAHDDGVTGDIITSHPIYSGGMIVPRTQNVYSLGAPYALWSAVYAGNGTIQVSDERVKENITDIPEAALRAWGKVNFKQFQFKDAVAKKGMNARIHTGLVAQQILSAFQSEGLDARRYGLFCWDEWEDKYESESVLVKPEVRGQVKVVDAQAIYNTVYKEDGSEEQVLVSPEKSHMEEQVIEEAVYRTEKKLVQPAGERYSLRYDQCLCMEAAYQRWRLDQLEAKLS